MQKYYQQQEIKLKLAALLKKNLFTYDYDGSIMLGFQNQEIQTGFQRKNVVNIDYNVSDEVKIQKNQNKNKNSMEFEQVLPFIAEKTELNMMNLQKIGDKRNAVILAQKKKSEFHCQVQQTNKIKTSSSKGKQRNEKLIQQQQLLQSTIQSSQNNDKNINNNQEKQNKIINETIDFDQEIRKLNAPSNFQKNMQVFEPDSGVVFSTNEGEKQIKLEGQTGGNNFYQEIPHDEWHSKKMFQSKIQNNKIQLTKQEYQKLKQITGNYQRQPNFQLNSKQQIQNVLENIKLQEKQKNSLNYQQQKYIKQQNFGDNNNYQQQQEENEENYLNFQQNNINNKENENNVSQYEQVFQYRIQSQQQIQIENEYKVIEKYNNDKNKVQTIDAPKFQGQRKKSKFFEMTKVKSLERCSSSELEKKRGQKVKFPEIQKQSQQNSNNNSYSYKYKQSRSLSPLTRKRNTINNNKNKNNNQILQNKESEGVIYINNQQKYRKLLD